MHFAKFLLLRCALSALLLSAFGHSSMAFQNRYYDPLDGLFDNGMSTIPAVNNPLSTIVAGSSFKDSWGREMVSVTELDQNGSIIWEFFYLSPNSMEQRCFSIDYSVNNQGYVLTGYLLESTSGLYKSFVMEIDLMGNLVWERTYDQLTVGLTIVKTTQNEYLVGGFASTGIAENAGGRAGVVLKLDGMGIPVWERGFYTNSLTSPEPYYDFVETIVELNPNEFYITGSVSGIFDDGFGNQQKVQKILSAKIHTSGTLIWNRSFGDYNAQTLLSDSWEVGADAEFDPHTQQIFLLANNLLLSGDEFVSVYEIDPGTGGINSETSLIHDPLNPIKTEHFHANQLLITASHVEVFGYATSFFDPCMMLDVYYPFRAQYDKFNSSSNLLTVHYNESFAYPQAMPGFLRIRSNALNTIAVPRVHSPQSTLKRTDNGQVYYTHLSYNTAYSTGHTFELFDDLHGSPICQTISTTMDVLPPMQKDLIPFYWEPITPTTTLYPFVRAGVSRLSDVCQGVACTPPAPMPLGLEDSNAPVLELNLFPNPANDKIHVSWENPLAHQARLELYNSVGQQVLIQELNKHQLNTVLKLSSLPKGWYSLRFTSSTGYTSQKPLVIR